MTSLLTECTHPGCPEDFADDLGDRLFAHGVQHVLAADHLQVYTPTGRILQDIADERARQDTRWGVQSHPDGTGPAFDRLLEQTRQQIADAVAAGAVTWRHIFLEEVVEALAETGPVALRTELVQVAAVATNWAEHLDRRGVRVTSFGYGHADAPTGTDLVLDVRDSLRNPHHDPAMRQLTGLHPRVAEHVLATPGARDLVDDAIGQVLRGTAHHVAVGCVGGRHRSVALAVAITDALTAAGRQVTLVHRDVHKPVLPAGGHTTSAAGPVTGARQAAGVRRDAGGPA